MANQRAALVSSRYFRMIFNLHCTPGDLWLLDPLLRNKQPVVEIHNSHLDGWYNGELEKRRGWVSTVLDERNEMGHQGVVATFVPLEPLPDGKPSLVVPTKYLRPVHPDEMNQMAIVLGDTHKGEVVLVRSVDNAEEYTVSNVERGIFDVPQSRLVLQHIQGS